MTLHLLSDWIKSDAKQCDSGLLTMIKCMTETANILLKAKSNISTYYHFCCFVVKSIPVRSKDKHKESRDLESSRHKRKKDDKSE